MTHPVTLEIPDSIYNRLSELARTQGRRLEEIALEKLSGEDLKTIEDPLDEFIGAFESDVPEWAERHDEYLGENLYREMRGEER